jgi:hypothetical protein
MKYKENVVAYILHVEKNFNTIRGLGETVVEPMIVQNVLRSLPLRFDAKVYAIEDLDKIIVDELHEILTYKGKLSLSVHMKMAHYN